MPRQPSADREDLLLTCIACGGQADPVNPLQFNNCPECVDGRMTKRQYNAYLRRQRQQQRSRKRRSPAVGA